MSNKESHWQKTKNHMLVTLAIWFFFSIVIFMFGESVNQGSFLGYPLAYYMSAQGSLAAFVILIFWFANKQEKIDDEHGYGGEREDDSCLKVVLYKTFPRSTVCTLEVS